MSWYELPISNPNTTGVKYGSDQLKLISRYFNGEDLTSTNPVTIGTDTTFDSEAFRIKAPTSGFSYIFQGKDIAADRIIQLPLMTGTGEIALSAAGAANDWGTATQTFRNQYLELRNPANTFSYIVNTSAITADRNIIIPLLTGDDTITFNNATQTLSNKTLNNPTFAAITLNTDSNTIKHSATNISGDILVNNGTKYARFPKGTAGQHLAVKSDESGIEWATPATGGGGSPTIINDFVPAPGGTHTGVWGGGSGTAASGILNGRITELGTSSHYFSSANKVTGRTWSVDSSTSERGWYIANNFTQRNMNPDLHVYFQYDKGGDQLGPRLWMGFTSDSTVSYDDSDVFSLNSLSGFVLHQRSDASDWNITINDGDASQNENFLQTADDDIHDIRLFADETNTRWGYSLDEAAPTYFTTEIPAATTSLSLIISATRNDASTRNLRIFHATFSHDVPTV